jgi:hypothetical protein
MAGPIAIEHMIPGAFVTCPTPGGWTDSATRLHVPGPIVEVSNDTERRIVGIAELRPPVQLFHAKKRVTFERKRPSAEPEKIVTVVPFDEEDEFNVHGGLWLAIQTGAIRHVSDEEMQRDWPEQWAARKENLVFDPEAIEDQVVNMVDLARQFRETQRTQREAKG